LDFSKYGTQFESFADDVFKASNQWGFFVLKGTAINNVDRMFQLSHDFFTLPVDEKATKIMNDEAIGYDGTKLTTFAASEGISFGSLPGGILETQNLPSWWDLQKRKEIEAFKAQCYELSASLMTCFAVRLGFEKDYFQNSHLHKAPGNTLKMIKYPQLDQSIVGDDIPRLSEHTDWGTITFVFAKTGGLEIRDPSNQWCEVPVIEDGIVVNIGDALSLWTGKALKSTMHRITWEHLPLSSDRYSIAYFTNPNLDAVLQGPGGHEGGVEEPAVTYKDYYKIRLGLTYGSLEDTATGNKILEEVDPVALDAVRRLGVANSGILESHARVIKT